jgi:hypothetical protein
VGTFVVSLGCNWLDDVPSLEHGAHLAIFAESVDVAVNGRLAGLEFRDTILVLRPGPRTSYVFLFRRPINENTVAGQALATGTGGLNIGACRVGSGVDKGIWPITQRVDERTAMAGPMRASETDTTVGRWPPNVVLIHAPGCVRTGNRIVQKHGGDGERSKTSLTSNETVFGRVGDDRGGRARVSHYTDGRETVPAYECVSGCPVKILDDMSGLLTSGKGRSDNTSDGQRTVYSHGLDKQGPIYGDTGGASRFFPQFESEGELRVWLTRLLSP